MTRWVGVCHLVKFRLVGIVCMRVYLLQVVLSLGMHCAVCSKQVHACSIQANVCFSIIHTLARCRATRCWVYVNSRVRIHASHKLPTKQTTHSPPHTISHSTRMQRVASASRSCCRLVRLSVHAVPCVAMQSSLQPLHCLPQTFYAMNLEEAPQTFSCCSLDQWKAVDWVCRAPSLLPRCHIC